MRQARDCGEMLELDGSHGEGGGQILRTGVSLAALTGRAVRFRNIRARRRVPGLAAQHLTSVRAAAALCSAQLQNDALGSMDSHIRAASGRSSGLLSLRTSARRGRAAAQARRASFCRRSSRRSASSTGEATSSSKAARTIR